LSRQLICRTNEVVVVSMPILSYDPAAAEWRAAESARLMVLGKTSPFVDGQIMAIAHANSLILVTLNPSDYTSSYHMFCMV